MRGNIALAARMIVPDSRSTTLQDVQFAPDEKTLLVSTCAQSEDQDLFAITNCQYVIHSLETGATIEELPELVAARRASFSAEGHWIVSGNTLLHLPSRESRVFETSAQVSSFAPNGDLVAVLDDGSLGRYCRD